MSKGILLALAILLTLGFLSFNLLNLSPAPEDRETLGKILEVKGEILSKTTSQDFYTTASKGQNLYSMQKLLTSFDSQSLVDFGSRFWVMPNSSIRLEKNKGNYNVHILSGSIKMSGKNKEATQNTHFFVEGKERVGTIIEKGAVAQMTHLSLNDIQVENPVPPKGNTSSVSEKQLHQTFRLHQRFVEKCFIKHYSRTSGQTRSGKVWIRFMIGKEGKLHQPTVRKSDYQDKSFHSCLLEVVSRVQLKNYTGSQMQVEFPIDIRLPQ